MSRILLWLFIINLGVALGAGLYESRIVVPDWTGTASGGTPQWNAAAVRHDDTGRRFWMFVTTGPLTLLTLASAIVAWSAPRGARRWWLGAAAAALADRALTLGYFIPTMIRLSRTGTPVSDATDVAMQWASLNHVRHALLLMALLAALKAFAELYAGRGAEKALRELVS
jgi:hypothetical protein